MRSVPASLIDEVTNLQPSKFVPFSKFQNVANGLLPIHLWLIGNGDQSRDRQPSPRDLNGFTPGYSLQ
jgi:hypothetical protein